MNLTLLFFQRYLLSKHSGSVVRTIARICLGGISLGFIAMIVVMSIMNGFGDSIRNRLLAVEPHVVVKLSPTTTRPEFLNQEKQIAIALRGIDGLTIQPFDQQDVILRSIDGNYTGAVAHGSSTIGLKRALEKVDVEAEGGGAVDEGAPAQPTNADKSDLFNLKPNEVFIGVDLARQLGVFEGNDLVVVSPENLLLPEGEIPAYENVKIKAVLRTNVADYDSQMLFYKRDNSLKRFNDSASLERGVEIRLNDVDRVDEVAERLRAQHFVIETWKDRNSALFYSLKMEKFMMGLFLGLTLLISSFSIVIVLFLLLAQKQKDIGMLMAMGLSPQKSVTLFTRLGLLLSALGGSLGLFIGLGICWLWEKYPLIKLPDIYYDTKIPARVDYTMVAGMVVVGAIVAYLSARIPAKRSAVSYPIQALRAQKEQES